MLTVIIPCLNEQSNFDLIKKNLTLLREFSHLIVIGNSKDGSNHFFKENNINFINSPPSRGLQQLNGAKISKTEWLFFLHADTRLNEKNFQQIRQFLKTENINKVAFFKLKYKNENLIKKIISGWANIRTKYFNLPFGDQGLLVSRKYYFELGGHSNLKVMEDMEFILKVKKKNRVLLESAVSTSFRKFENNGVIKQGILHILCQAMFLLGLNKKKIYKFYKQNEK